MSDVSEFDFSGSTGAEAAEKISKESNSSFAREVEFLSLDASPAGIAQGKNKALVRFLTNFVDPPEGVAQTKYNLGWITLPGHYAPTKTKPPYAKDNWPAKMGAGCRKGKPFVGKYNGQCYICDNLGVKPSNQTWALAVEREEVRDDQGKILGYQDKTREVTATDENGNFIVEGKNAEGKDQYAKKVVPAYVIISKGWRNFFQPLKAAAGYFQSLLDGDWLITRTGEKADDTSYAPIRVAEQFLPEGNPYGLPGGTKYDLAIPGLMEKVYPDMPDLRKTLVDRVSDETFGRWFIPGWLPEGFEEGQNGQSSSSAPAQPSPGMMMMSSPSNQPTAPETPKSEEPSNDALAALKNRVMGG